ncbi:LPXTG cell wall anchor domain-containing protein [Leucobacter sp. PH1c]|uniref:LPXTG cell wall anchor domain-containing protein n=1 Tax=Leucobacter sp. PH1c TaxID=1397278 RepID=UPI00046838E3|nr:LPXTG cell wall anchor domain-containing protein [Leucobacter sp. PH1c]
MAPRAPTAGTHVRAHETVWGNDVKKMLATGVLTVLGLGTAAGATLGAMQPAPAQAAVGDVVCDVFHGGIRNLQVVQSGERTFKVTVVDQNTLAGEDTAPGADDRYAPLPPEFRDAVNRVILGASAVASEPRVSQTVVTGPASDPTDSDWQVDRLVQNEAAPWERAMLTGREVTWVHDIDARTIVSGGVVSEQVRPSDFPAVWLLADESSSVLQFTLTVPDDAVGTVSLVESLSGSFVSTTWSEATWSWSKDKDIDYVQPISCSVTFAEGPTEPATDPGTDPATDPGTDPATEPATDPATDPGTDPATDPGTDPATDPATDPGTDPSTDPTTDPGTEPSTDPTALDGGTTDGGPGTTKPQPGTGTQLAKTGAPSAALALAGGSLLLAGGAGLLLARRRRARS